MNVPASYLKHQLPMLGTLAKAALSAAKKPPKTNQAKTGVPVFETVKPRQNELVDSYIRWCGGNPDRYTQTLPPHLFPQWGFPLMSSTLQGIPYAITGVLNQGVTMTVHHNLERDQPLELEAQLVSVDDDGYKARIHQRLVTGTKSTPNAIVADVHAVVLLKKGDAQKGARPAEKTDWKAINTWHAALDDGRNFAFLTGDLNPIHWIGPYAKMAGFKRQILHGFGSFARSYEVLANHHHPKSMKTGLSHIDVRFTRPLVLPAQATVEIRKEGKPAQNFVRLLDAKGTVCMAGEYRT